MASFIFPKSSICVLVSIPKIANVIEFRKIYAKLNLKKNLPQLEHVIPFKGNIWLRNKNIHGEFVHVLLFLFFQNFLDKIETRTLNVNFDGCGVPLKCETYKTRKEKQNRSCRRREGVVNRGSDTK